jgi:hypothetical protein
MWLPESVPSSLGPVPVTVVESIHEDGRRGELDEEQRRISVRGGQCDAMLWQTLFHECAHLALFDGAAHEMLTERQTEAVCNTVGTWLAAAVLAGWLVVRVPDASGIAPKW